MKFKDNAGVDPVTLSRGFTRLEGDPPNSGENILNPRHVEERKRMEALRTEYGWPDEQPEDDGPEGFLERREDTPFNRPNRNAYEDLG